jgi:thiamine-monophosphate kinase
VAEALWIAERYQVSAAIDVSDGLAKDLWQICEESGCGAEVTDDRIPIAPAARTLAAQLGESKSALERAYGDGEDFELILAMPPTEADGLLADAQCPIPVTRIGSFLAERGLSHVDSTGQRRELPPLGYEH